MRVLHFAALSLQFEYPAILLHWLHAATLDAADWCLMLQVLTIFLSLSVVQCCPAVHGQQPDCGGHADEHLRQPQPGAVQH
jgi:hypothetical protein